MRQKAPPQFLSCALRKRKAFFCSPRVCERNCEAGRSPRLSHKKKFRLYEAEEKKLSDTYPHSIHLMKEPAQMTNLLHTFSIPITHTISESLRGCEKLTLYFNQSSFLLLWQDFEIMKHFISLICEEVASLLYAASSSVLDVHWLIDSGSLLLNVCIKERAIDTSFVLPEIPLSKSQYMKMLDIMIVHSMEEALPVPNYTPFIFTHHSETQTEFVSLLKSLFDFSQQAHQQRRDEWMDDRVVVQHPNMTAILRPYQSDAVMWMVYKESYITNPDLECLYGCMFHPFTLSNGGGTLNFSLHSGIIMRNLPRISPMYMGGILADEMGLGKTLEVISLLHAHPCIKWLEIGGKLMNTDGQIDQVSHPSVPPTENPADFVLCSCGNVDESCDFARVQCSRCFGPHQHAVCMQYEAEGFSINLPNPLGYVCPTCWCQLRIQSKATLIVAPDHIWQQWKEEFQTHLKAGALNILLYAGMEAPVTLVELGSRMNPDREVLKNNNGSSHKSRHTFNPYSPRTRVPVKRLGRSQTETDEWLPGFVQPAVLACADVVLTSYSVVQRELDWAEVTAERRSGIGNRPALRLTQRYLCRPSPLTCVWWWRVVLDEAQMVQRVTSKTARMMSQISAVYRWCVTGTPAEKSISDLYGLFAYLRFEPYSIPHYWNSLLYQPFLAATTKSWYTCIDPSEASPTVLDNLENGKQLVESTLLAQTLSQILWRNTKLLVGDQLCLPPITEQIHWVDFTPIERYIHDRVLAQSVGTLQRLCQEVSHSLDQPLSSLPSSAHCRLINLVTRLRQACTHASLVVGGTTANRPKRRHHNFHDQHRRGNHRREIFGEQDELEDTGAGPTVSDARRHRSLGTGCSTMTQVIRRVVDDTRRECEGLLRSWVFDKNGTAGCFIIKQQYVQAAECYRTVLSTAANLETRHGVLADWSQRLHAITNLHWLIQSHHVPLIDEPPPSANSHGPAADSSLDPRVDRDLLAKAKKLRMSYIQMHSHLLSRVYSVLEPLVATLDKEFIANPEDISDQTDDAVAIYGSDWLDWIANALHFLISNSTELDLLEMLSTSFQGKPNSYRGRFRTTLLYAKTFDSFKAILLTELLDVFKARQRLREAMKPVISTWRSFVAGEEADLEVLRPFYDCCARTTAEDSVDEAGNVSSNSQQDKKKKAGKSNELVQLEKTASHTRKRVKKTRCAYCVALLALSNYQSALNHERPKSSDHSTLLRQSERQWDDEITFDELDDAGNGLIHGNPLIVALTIVCHQVIKRHDHAEQGWGHRARKFQQMFKQMGKELLLTSRTLSLTKEWWNIHDDTEQFVVRLQATCPSDLAFIHSHEVDAQLQSYIVEADMMWPRLQSRLMHFKFLRNAHLAAVTTTRDEDNKSSAYRLECPTCLCEHSPSNPTFALLPGCWHTLCVPCHQRMLAVKKSQRRCPICRTPFESDNDMELSNARRRRPLTLIHYSDDIQQSRVHGRTDEQSVCASTLGSIVESNQPPAPIVGDHSSKVQAVISCLNRLKEEDPDAKVIVFSSWLSVLVTIAGALDLNGLSYVTLFNSRDACSPGRLAGFQCSGSATWILLMPIQLGANGLNLTSANHLILIDPVLSHGREAQAIARMHRIGQTRPSVVHRFLMHDSIEAALHHAHVHSKSRINIDSTNSYSEDPTDCMIGAGSKRTSSTTCGVAGPGEDKAYLMQMTLSQLTDLLHTEANTGMLQEELTWSHQLESGSYE